MQSVLSDLSRDWQQLMSAFGLMSLLFMVAGTLSPQAGESDATVVGRLATGAEIVLMPAEEGQWGLEIRSPGLASLRQARPARIDLFNEKGKVSSHAAAYQSITRSPAGFVGKAEVSPRPGLSFQFEDHWKINGALLEMDRKVQVAGDAPEGFASALMLETVEDFTWPDIRYFVPGAMYGAPEHVRDRSPGGMLNLQRGRVEMREDSMPAPIFGLYFGDGTSAALLDRHPRSDTTAEDATEPAEAQICERFLFGAMGGRERSEGGIEFGYWFPGTGEQLEPASAAAAEAQGERRGRRRMQVRTHPVRDGFAQAYQLAIRLGREERFHDFYRNAWRAAWAMLQPRVCHHDIEVVRRSLIDMMGEQVRHRDGRTGLPNSIDIKTQGFDHNLVIGFTGKNLEAAVFMLMEADRGRSPRDAEHRRKALAIIDTFLGFQVAPPEGEGIHLDTGEKTVAIPRDRGEAPQVYLRSFSDDMKILLHGYKFEKQRGREHPQWLEWCAGFGDWLLTQQQPAGGFPRSWVPRTGEVKVEAPQSSYNPVPLLVLLSELTGELKYQEAAERAAEFCWATEQIHDHFVGGTIDNPNVQDKEAATLSTEAYLALYEATQAPKWLERAQAAAENAETYAYIWDVFIPEDADDTQLHWKKGVSMLGVNVCSTSSPGAGDQYLAFDVDEYAKLYKYTGDRHYFDVARFLLHNTKSMLALPGRAYDLPGPGWQSEHWSLTASRRGRGGNYIWLPWVSTSHLNGIILTEQFDPELFQQLAAP